MVGVMFGFLPLLLQYLVIPALRRLKQKDQELEAVLDYTVKPGLKNTKMETVDIPHLVE